MERAAAGVAAAGAVAPELAGAAAVPTGPAGDACLTRFNSAQISSLLGQADGPRCNAPEPVSIGGAVYLEAPRVERTGAGTPFDARGARDGSACGGGVARALAFADLCGVAAEAVALAGHSGGLACCGSNEGEAASGPPSDADLSLAGASGSSASSDPAPFGASCEARIAGDGVSDGAVTSVPDMAATDAGALSGAGGSGRGGSFVCSGKRARS